MSIEKPRAHSGQQKKLLTDVRALMIARGVLITKRGETGASR